MDLERAMEINRQVFDAAIAPIMENKLKSLPADVSLEEMLVATRIVSESNAEARSQEGQHVTHVTVDPRMIALLYAFERHGKSVIRMLDALGFSINEDEIDFCAGCWTFRAANCIEWVKARQYCPDCREIFKEQENAETTTETTSATD